MKTLLNIHAEMLIITHFLSCLILHSPYGITQFLGVSLWSSSHRRASPTLRLAGWSTATEADM